MLWTRIASGAVLAPLFLLVVYLETPWFNIFAGAIGVMVAFEYMRLTGFISTGVTWNRHAILAVATPPVAVIALETGGLSAGVAAVAALIVLMVLSGRASSQAVAGPIQAAIAYAALPAVALAYVMDVGGAVSVFWLVAVVWATDIGAYAVGRIVGGPKLAPSISPQKTWPGALGGVVAAMLAASTLLWGYGLTVTLALAGLAAGLSVISQVGDLFESALKRHYHVKDSGSLIPGHGGIMDRFDGLWAAAPVVAAVCVVMQGGVRQW